MNRKLFLLVIVLLAAVVLPAGTLVAASDQTTVAEVEPNDDFAHATPVAADVVTLTGTLTVIVGDPMPDDATDVAPIPPIFTLHLADGRDVRLLPGAADENALLMLNRQQVTVTTPAAAAEAALTAGDERAAVAVQSIGRTPGTAEVSTAVTGNVKWLSIACKFADVADEPKPLSYFTDMYANAYPGFDHYWREASYGAINLVGSTARGWYTLPHPASYYIIDDQTLKWDELFLDCAALADPYVNFGDYLGVNLMFNAEMGCCAWGGSWPATLDGVTKEWSVTWLPPWGYQHTVIAHEMTHAFGIAWHSYAGNNEYGDPWDVVSNAWYGCDQNKHPDYGCLGQHTSAYHRDYLGWIPAARKTVVGSGVTTVTLERTTQPGANGYLMAIVPIDGSTTHYYTLEARQHVSYDGKLPGESLVIYEIGGPRHPVQLIDQQAELNWGGGVWTPGETWVAPYGGIMARIETATAGGFIVTVSSGLPSQSVTLNPTADTYVDATTPQTNYGYSSILRTRHFMCSASARTTMLRFDTTQFPPQAARFHLRVKMIEETGEYYRMRVKPFPTTYYDSSEPWTEGGLNWANAWGGGCWFYTPEAYGPTRTGNWLEWDITTLATSENIGSLSRIAALVIDNGEIGFSSREGANPPQLIIDYLVPLDTTETHTFAPTNDAYVTQAKPKNVFGAQKVLQVKDAAKDVNSYVKFNVAGLDGTVQSATLRLYVVDPGPDGGKVYAVSPFYLNTTTQWLETGLKWNNAPAIGGAPLGAVGNAAKGQWVELDVTAAVIAALGNNGRVSLALTNDSRNLVTYSSKEGAHPPELVVITN